MTRQEMVETIGKQYLTTNLEEDEWSYVVDAGSKQKLEALLYRPFKHFKLDRRFIAHTKDGDYAILIETKQSFKDEDISQLREYMDEERALHRGERIIAILANTTDNKIKVWKTYIDDEHFLKDETVLDTMEHYQKLFRQDKQNDRERVMKNTYALNQSLHKKNIAEGLRSQFVGTCLLYVKDQVNKILHGRYLNEDSMKEIKKIWDTLTTDTIRAAIGSVLDSLLDNTTNKQKKVALLKQNVLNNQHIRELTKEEWMDILTDIALNIYRYINEDSSEGQDILNLFFITFNKYTGKADKNQAFTPDHITDFMTKLTEVDRNSVVLDGTCGSGAFLVQAMVKALADCRKGRKEVDAIPLMEKVKKEHIYGIEVEELAFGLATTNMLIHGDGNSNIVLASIFDSKKFIKDAHPTVILMNPPYNAKPKGIPDNLKATWDKKQIDGKEDPTKGLIFIKYLADLAKEFNWENTKMAVLLPVSAAIGSNDILKSYKKALLDTSTLEAVFTLPNEIFYPGASASACCMLFTLNKPHCNSDGKPNKQTFFGYYKDDGFKKKKNLGRIEQFNSDGTSKWAIIEEEWLSLYRNKTVKDGLSAMQPVTGDDEWLCEAYMKTDYSKLTEADFQKTLNNYLAYLVKEGKVYEP